MCESRGGRPGLPSLKSLMVFVDVKHHERKRCRVRSTSDTDRFHSRARQVFILFYCLCPRVIFQCRLSYGVRTAPVCNRIQQYPFRCQQYVVVVFLTQLPPKNSPEKRLSWAELLLLKILIHVRISKKLVFKQKDVQ